MGWQIPEAKCISSLDCFEHFKPWWSKHSYLELDIKTEPTRGILVYRLYLLVHRSRSFLRPSFLFPLSSFFVGSRD